MTNFTQRVLTGTLIILFSAGLGCSPTAMASSPRKLLLKDVKSKTGNPALPASLQQALDSTLRTNWSQQAEFTASDGLPGDQFGDSVVLSSDGTTALVGAACAPYNPDQYQCGPGVAYVFTESGGAWTQTDELTASDGANGDDFGGSLALSADGTLALVGAPGRNVVYVFTDNGGTWTQADELSASDGGSQDGFGDAVALTPDGTTALIGAAGHNFEAGAAYVFTDSGGTWTQEAELTASDGASGDYFGFYGEAALSSDGTIALVGALGHNNYTGAAYVFTESGGAWTQQTELNDPLAMDYDAFGSAVALSGDGTTALIGSYGFYVLTGTAYVFSESGGTWTEQAQLPAAADGDEFGVSVALSTDGMTALVGAEAHDIANPTGAAYVFTEGGGTWPLQAELIASDGQSGDLFGDAVALDADGATALIGANQEFNYYLDGTGKAYVFTQPMARLGFRPASGAAGTTTHLLGAGFTPGETVDLSIGGRSGQVHADSDGKFAVPLQVPNVPPRRYTLTATGETSGLTAHATFTVTASRPGTMPSGPSNWVIGNR